MKYLSLSDLDKIAKIITENAEPITDENLEQALPLIIDAAKRVVAWEKRGFEPKPYSKKKKKGLYDH